MDRIRRLYRKLLPIRYAADQSVLIEGRRRHIERYKEKCPGSPALLGDKFFSQGDEDGITIEIIKRLGSTNKTFIEIGCGDGLENNTSVLLLLGFRGCWIDGNMALTRRIQIELLDRAPSERLAVHHALVDRHNCASILSNCADFLGTKDPDVLSVDIDSNDIGVLELALLNLQPKCVIIEYNNSIPPLSSIAITWQSSGWEYDDFQSGSLQSIVNVCTGYTLVACSSSGTNAFFVRNDLLGDQFPIYPIEDLFVNSQFHFNEIVVGHRRSYKWLKMALSGNEAR